MENQLNIEQLLYEEEGTTLDFKRESYKFSNADDHQKSEILKDILAFANAWRRADAYILLGVEEIKGGKSKVIGIQEELDDAQLQQFINKKTQRPIDFSYQTVLLEDLKVGIIKIPVQNRPFFSEKDYGKVKKGVVYIRRGSSTDEANPDEIFEMGRQQAEFQKALEIPDLTFEFANIENRISLGTTLDLNAIFIKIISSVPHYEENLPFMVNPFVNKNYYRELVEYYHVMKKSNKLSFFIKNDAIKTIPNIKIELLIRKGNSFEIKEKLKPLPSKDIQLKSPHQINEEKAKLAQTKSIYIKELSDAFFIEVRFEKVQPKQTVFCTENIFIAANESFETEIDVTIYADNIPEPIKKKLEISCNVTKEETTLESLLEFHEKH